MGSYTHAQSIYNKREKIKGLICLEMTGYFTTEEKSQNYSLNVMQLFYPSVGDFMAVAGNLRSHSLVDEVARYLKVTSLGVEKLKAPALLPGVGFLDYRNYWHFGI